MKYNKWNINNISDQKDRVVITTGSSSGIGFESARVLANNNAVVIIAVRNQNKGKKALQKIVNENSNANLRVMHLDLADLKSIKRFTEEFRSEYNRLDLLINNAGVMVPPYSKTEDGFELQIGTNHFGHFALTILLLDLIKNTSNSRIINVSSSAHRLGSLDFNDLNWEKRKYLKWRAYGDSKIANLYFTYELSRRLNIKDNNIIVAAAHPGWTATDLQRHNAFMNFFNKYFAQKPEMGALPILYAAVGSDIKSGDYFGPGGFLEMKGYPDKVESNNLSHDEQIAAQLWEISEKKTGVKYK